NNNGAFTFDAVTNSPGQTLTLDSTSSPTSITINSLTLVAGTLNIGNGASLDLLNSGITDVPSGAGLNVSGTFTTGGTTSALAGLNSVEGTVNLYGQSFTDTPGSGTLTIASGGQLTASYNSGTGVGTALTIKGSVNNSGLLATGVGNSNGGSTLTIT